MPDWLILTIAMILIGLLYISVLGLAMKDMGWRKERGKSNSVLVAILLLPLLGPLIYLVFRSAFRK